MNKHLSGSLFTKTVLTPSEQSVSKAIEQFLDAKRVYNDRLNSGKVCVKSPGGKDYWVQLCKKGTPDRFFITGGQIVFVEVKKRGRKPTNEQLARHEELKRSGAIVMVADSIDSFIEQFENLIS